LYVFISGQIHGDKSALTPGGVRLGSPALTSRGFVEKDFETVGGFLLRALHIALEVQATSGKKLDDFKKALVGRADCEKLKHEVEAFASTFSMPGLDPSKLKYQ
jgi:glycine hydroxymethyltransferase